MEELQANRFDRIVSENLPKRKAMLDILRENAMEATLFNTNGQGLSAVLQKMGRISDFKGIYAFIKNDQVVYLDESAYAVKRVIRHYKGSSKYQLKLAYLLKDYHSYTNPSYTLNEALDEMASMKLVFLDIPDDLERTLTTIYLQCNYECVYNRLE